jgi:acyl-CoA synthetase (AMP-forming)/AMP-acid ligase II
MIISGGENIASSELERVVYQLAQISEAAVIGMADEKWGEVPVVVAVLKTDAALDYDQLADHCRQQLAGFKVPKALYLTDALPRNPSGKVLKRVLREQYANQVLY